MRPADIIPVRFSEDLAQYAEVRSVRRQPMTLTELVGLVLASTGKQPERVGEILRHGTCTYNIYRYWWEGFTLDREVLEAQLAAYPDPDPSRPFAPQLCQWAAFRDAGEPLPRRVGVDRVEASVRRWFHRQSLWEFLVAFAATKAPAYIDYSYYDRADLYRAELDARDRKVLRAGIERLARASLRQRLARGLVASSSLSEGTEWVRLDLACRRPL